MEGNISLEVLRQKFLLVEKRRLSVFKKFQKMISLKVYSLSADRLQLNEAAAII